MILAAMRRKVKKGNRSFYGIQLICVSDIFSDSTVTLSDIADNAENGNAAYRELYFLSQLAARSYLAYNVYHRRVLHQCATDRR